MKLHSFYFEDKTLELQIGPIQFSDISLLVGVSGVGKTLILLSILELRKIAIGVSLDGKVWEIIFSTNEGKKYLWKGAFENTGLNGKGENNQGDEWVSTRRSKIDYEELYLNGDLIAERRGNKIKLEGNLTPKLSSYTSLLSLFSEEDIIRPAFEEVSDNIIKNYDANQEKLIKHHDVERLTKEFSSIESIRNSRKPTPVKLVLAYKNKLDIFTTIKEQFIAIFSQVEDMKFDKMGFSDNLDDFYYLTIKEKYVSKWIMQPYISSGMFKTLMQISEFFLCAEGTVILIDEFENSLGINCINTFIENLLYDDRDLQFIITSHHPYIINVIGMEHWKVVSRKGGVITAKDAEAFKLGRSRHEAFKQLIQLTAYRKGIAV